MTAPGKNIYVISIADAQGRMYSYTVVATTKVLAEAAACVLAGVEEGTETQSSQKSGTVDAEAE